MVDGTRLIIGHTREGIGGSKPSGYSRASRHSGALTPNIMSLRAGPNGAGKTTFINRLLRQRAQAFRFVNPDAGSLSRWERA